MVPLSYCAKTGVLRVNWCCYTIDPLSTFNISVYTESSKGENAKLQVWDWCTAGQCCGEHGWLDLKLPKPIADTVLSRSLNSWKLLEIELRFYYSRFGFLFSCPVPVIPEEPDESVSAGEPEAKRRRVVQPVVSVGVNPAFTLWKIHFSEALAYRVSLSWILRVLPDEKIPAEQINRANAILSQFIVDGMLYLKDLANVVYWLRLA